MAADVPMSPAERLERGEVLLFAPSLFPLPQGADLDFLLQQREGGLGHKNISYDPATRRLTGFLRTSKAQEERLRALLAAFSDSVTSWLQLAFPRYVPGCRLDRASFRATEEATRRARPTARNDLLHIDNFPNRPTQGRRILRVFANVSPTESRIWATAEPFARLLERYSAEVGIPTSTAPGWLRHLGAGVLSAISPGAHRSAYDSFMLRLHDFLKLNDDFQERSAKRLWTFAPGTAWVAMTDACTHAELRGRFALEHSYFIDPQTLARPELAPAALLAAASARARAGRAA